LSRSDLPVTPAESERREVPQAAAVGDGFRNGVTLTATGKDGTKVREPFHVLATRLGRRGRREFDAQFSRMVGGPWRWGENRAFRRLPYFAKRTPDGYGEDTLNRLRAAAGIAVAAAAGPFYQANPKLREKAKAARHARRVTRARSK
jgi:hypothetical protein